MQKEERATSSSQIDVDERGEYCIIKPDYLPNGVKTRKDTQTATQSTYSRNVQQEKDKTKVPPKLKVQRSISSPEQLVRSLYMNDKQSVAQTNGTQRSSGRFVVGPARRSTGHVKLGSRRSTGSLTGREPPPPLRYFAYLGRLHPTSKAPQLPRGRLPSAHDILADRPVILTSTSIVSPYATNVICREIEELEEQEAPADYNDLLDCCTCMCLVKALFYHCTKDTKDEGQLADDPCSCQGPVGECVGRWGIMGILSLFLPCLLCYLPFEACFKCQECMKKEAPVESNNSDRLPAKKSSVTDEPTSLTIDSRSDGAQ